MRTVGSQIAVIFLILTLKQTNCTKRTLDFAFNENCNVECKDKNVRLAHIKATGINDTIHYIWDFTKKPSLLIAVTSPSAKLQISWKNFLARERFALKFTESPIYTFGMVIERLFEFNDLDNNARIDQVKNKSNIYELHFKNFNWHHKNMSKNEDFVEFYAEANTFRDPVTNDTREGSLKFMTHTFGKRDHSHIMPRLLHSENDTQLDIIINNFKTKKEFYNSRFALQLLFASDGNGSSKFSIDSKKKLDDEFTPGIFEVTELTTPFIKEKSAFLQWRPISYVATERDVTNSTGIEYYPLKNVNVNDYFDTESILYIYYGDKLFDKLVQKMNVSFGSVDDGYYNAKHYNSWTFLVGYGAPLEERFSKISIIMICVGAGIPVFILFISAIYICVRHIRRDNGERLR